jgi:serine/threonine protein kinase
VICCLIFVAENVLVKETNVVKIADFGLAIAVHDIPFDVEKSFHPAGTDCYMPPEVCLWLHVYCI